MRKIGYIPVYSNMVTDVRYIYRDPTHLIISHKEIVSNDILDQMIIKTDSIIEAISTPIKRRFKGMPDKIIAKKIHEALTKYV